MTVTGAVTADPRLTAAVADFLYQEAALLDSRSFEAWLDLYAADATYSVPQDAQADPVRRVALLYEDKRRLAERVARVRGGFAYAQEPASRTVHLVGNVRVAVAPDGTLAVSSNLVLTEVRRGRQHVYAGEVDHRLRRAGDGFEIAFKEVRLVNSDLPLGNLTILP